MLRSWSVPCRPRPRRRTPTSAPTSTRCLGQGDVVMKYLLIGFIQAWRFAISPLYGQVCRYHPTCSAYALEAVTEHGCDPRQLARGTSAARCHPWAAGGYDPVPSRAVPAGGDPCNSRSMSARLLRRHRRLPSWRRSTTSSRRCWWASTSCSVASSDPETGVAWVLSIIGLTLVIRIALIPLFVKQIKSSRNMQLIQPKVQRAAEEVRPRPGASRAGDDEALQGLGHQPVRLVPADPAADADLPGAVPPDRPGREEPRGEPKG